MRLCVYSPPSRPSVRPLQALLRIPFVARPPPTHTAFRLWLWVHTMAHGLVTMPSSLQGEYRAGGRVHTPSRVALSVGHH